MCPWCKVRAAKAFRNKPCALQAFRARVFAGLAWDKGEFVSSCDFNACFPILLALFGTYATRPVFALLPSAGFAGGARAGALGGTRVTAAPGVGPGEAGSRAHGR